MQEQYFTLSEKINKFSEISQKLESNPKILNQNEKNIPQEEIKHEKPGKKDIYTKSRHNSDLTDLSYTPTETLSQTSDYIFFPSDSKQSLNMNKSYSSQNSLHDNCFDYFQGIEDHFKKTESEKFHEYKSSKNYLPKKKREVENVNNEYQNMQYQDYLYGEEDENKMNNNNNNYFVPFGNNIYNNNLNGNIFYYIYNNFYFNCLNTMFPRENNIKQEKVNIEEKTTPNNYKDNKEEKTENKEKKEEIEDNGIEIIVTNKKTKKDEKYDDRKYNNKNFNHRYNKNDIEVDIDYYDNKDNNEQNNYWYRNKNDYYSYYDSIPMRTFSNYHRRKYIRYEYNNKFNGFNDQRRKRYNGENNFFKKKFSRQMYY
jgi:hypothetical protein